MAYLIYPYTVTGYVRKYCLSESRKDKKNRTLFRKTALSYDLYKVVKASYKGGYTHTNIDYRSVLIEGDIKHFDFESHYPTVMLLEKYPITSFKNYGKTNRKTLEQLYERHSILIKLKVKRCKLKFDRHFTYIQTSEVPNSAINDNGRVYACFEPFEITITYEDLLIIERQYDIDYAILDTWCALKGRLPDYMINSLLHFFTDKNDLKIQVHNEKDITKKFDLQTKLMRTKGMLNGIYGMTATDPIRSEFEILEDGTFYKYQNVTSEEEKLKRFYKSRNSFLPYQWGTWVTAFARYYLFNVIDLIGEENVIYCDTDSAFFINKGNAMDKIQEFNDMIRKKSIDTDSYIMVNDKRKYIGEFADEEENISKFKALHSKCYMYQDEDGIHNTIAGVVKAYKDDKGNVHMNTEELNNFDDFEDGFTFSTKFGGTCSKYTYAEPHIEYFDGHKTDIASGIVIENITKTLHNNYDKVR